LHYPLDEIKRKLDMKKDKTIRDSEVEKHVNAVTQQMQQLQNDLYDLTSFIEKLDDMQKEKFATNLMMLKSVLKESLLRITS
jgi:MerR family transcriptional regulator, copper efflux regulator